MQVTQELSDTKSEFKSVVALAEEIRSALKPGLEPKLQTELAALINLLPSLAKVNDLVLEAQARIIADALLSEIPNVDLARVVCKRLTERLKARNSLFFSLIQNGSPAVKVVLGLGVLLYFVIPIAIYVGTIFSKYETVFGIKINMLGLVAFSGALGSIVSIMVRLHEFSRVNSVDQSVLFFTGFFKPIVGTAFALFIFAILSSGLIPVVIPAEKVLYFYAALSFVAGFSERFAQDVVTKTEAAIGHVSKASDA